MRTLGIVRRLVGCFYCGQPCRGDVCRYCSDLPLRDPCSAGSAETAKVKRLEAELAAMTTRAEPTSTGLGPKVYVRFLMTDVGTFTREAVEEMAASIESLEAEVAILKKEKSILMRELSRFTNAA